MNLMYPYQIDGRGYTRVADDAQYIRGLIEQVLFTAPGERVMRPDFGCGLKQLVFAPNSFELAATTQFLVQSALQQWLGNLISVEEVAVEAIDSTLRVTVNYVIKSSGTRQAEIFVHGGNA